MFFTTSPESSITTRTGTSTICSTVRLCSCLSGMFFAPVTEPSMRKRDAVQEWKKLFRGTAKGQKRLEEAERRTRDTAGERAAKRIKLQFADRPADHVSSSSSSRKDATAGGDAASASNVVAGGRRGGVAQNAGNAVAGGAAPDAAQDTAISGGDDRRRTIPRETEDDEERAKRQRTEKKTELEMEVSNVAKINDRRRILDLRRDVWELENIRHRDAAMFCTCELRPRVIRTRCTQRNRDTRAGIRVRIRRQHRRRSHDEEHPEQHRVQWHDHP